MPTIIPLVPALGNYRLGTALPTFNGVDWNTTQNYIFDVRYNSRELAWYLNVRDIDEKLIRGGIKLVTGVYLGRTCVHPLFRSGALVLRPVGSDRRDATYWDLGLRLKLWYFTQAEVVRELLASMAGSATQEDDSSNAGR